MTSSRNLFKELIENLNLTPIQSAEVLTWTNTLPIVNTTENAVFIKYGDIIVGKARDVKEDYNLHAVKKEDLSSLYKTENDYRNLYSELKTQDFSPSQCSDILEWLNQLPITVIGENTSVEIKYGLILVNKTKENE